MLFRSGSAGKELDKSLFTFTGGTDKDKYLNITAVDKSVGQVSAIIVKGGDGYNIYVPEGPKGMSGEPSQWTKLRSPLNGGGQQANISHWFVCGTISVQSPGSTAPTKPSEPVKTTKPSAPAVSETSVSPTSTTPAAVPAGNESGTGGGLANTGFDNSWLIWVAGLLLVVGGGLLALLKFRRKASE